MDLGSIERCLELEGDGTVRGVDMDIRDNDFAPLLQNVFRLRLPGRKDVIVVLNRG